MTEKIDYHNQFIGTDKIQEITEKDGLSVVRLKNDVSYEVPTLVLPRLVTKEKNETGATFQDMKLAAIAKDIFELLTKVYDLRMSEVERLCGFVKNVIGNDFEAATRIKWGKFQVQIKLSEITKILKDNIEQAAEIKNQANADPTTQAILEQNRKDFAARNQ